jgi:16S rRNA (guanine527-N7)-methyltransferase
MSNDDLFGHPDGVPDSRAGHGLISALERSRDLGYLGPGPIATHVRNARAFLGGLVDLAGEDDLVVDLGSGGGVPGLVLAVLRPDLPIALLDGSTTRCEFLGDVIDTMDLSPRVVVRCQRAESAGRDPEMRSTARGVVARSFAGPAVTAECAAPLLAVGGRILVSEPPSEPSDPSHGGDFAGAPRGPRPRSQAGGDRWPTDGLAALGLALGRRFETAGSTVQELVVERLTDDRFPRRVGIPAKRPLF